MTDILDDICKDFAIVYADAERALALTKGLNEKFRQALTTIPYRPGDADEYECFHQLRGDCIAAIDSLLDKFDSPFARSVLGRADKAIVKEWEEEKANEQKLPTPTQEELIEMVDAHIKETVEELAKALAVEEKVSRENCFLIIRELKGIAQYQKLEKERRNRFLNQAFRKMQLIVIPLLQMALATNSIDEDGNENEDKETLIQAALEILTESLKLTRGFEE